MPTALRRRIARTMRSDAANARHLVQIWQVECSTLHGNGFWKTRLFNLPYPSLKTTPPFLFVEMSFGRIPNGGLHSERNWMTFQPTDWHSVVPLPAYCKIQASQKMF